MFSRPVVIASIVISILLVGGICVAQQITGCATAKCDAEMGTRQFVNGPAGTMNPVINYHPGRAYLHATDTATAVTALIKSPELFYPSQNPGKLLKNYAKQLCSLHGEKGRYKTIRRY